MACICTDGAWLPIISRWVEHLNRKRKGKQAEPALAACFPWCQIGRMLRNLPHSLMFRLGLMMAAISLLAVLAASSSLMMTSQIEGEAESVNLAGALRMQTYRIATMLVYDNSVDLAEYRRELARLIADFEEQLFSPALTVALHSGSASTLEQAYQRVTSRWHDEIRPLLDMYLSGLMAVDDPISEDARTVIRARYLDYVPAFVSVIDEFVGLLAQDAETKIRRLQLYQYSILAATLLLVALALFLAWRKVRLPLQALLGLANRAGHGDFSGRTPFIDRDELGQLGQAFNLMSRDLEQLYQNLEERVRSKTADLERSRRSIELLYRTVSRLQDQGGGGVDYAGLLTDVQELAETGPGTICLSDNVEAGAMMLASTFDHSQWDETCPVNECERCLQRDAAVIRLERSRDDEYRVFVTPIRDKSRQYGVLLTQLPSGSPPDSWQKRLLATVADHIGIALSLSRQGVEQRRLALLEERSVIARELHDSLAQALAYLKIQVARLEQNLRQPGDEADTEIILSEIRRGLTGAYRELRELLTTFRLRVGRQDLNNALSETVREFCNRASVEIRLDYRLQHSELGANEEIHLLQIVREALTNVVNHSGADQCVVMLMPLETGGLVLSIDDNGRGFSQTGEKQFHYGLTIMRERASSLGGDLELGVSDMGGARVKLRFTPECRRNDESSDKVAL